MPPTPRSQRLAGAHVEIEGRNDKFLKMLENIDRNLDKVARDSEKANARIGKSSRDAEKDVGGLQDRIDSTRRTIQRLNQQGRIKPEVSGKALQDLAKLEGAADRLSKKEINIQAGIVGRFDQELRDLERGIRRVDGKEIRIGVNTQVPSAIASLVALNAAVDAIDGRKIKVDSSALREGGANANIFARGLSLLAAVAAVKIPVVITLLGFAATAITQLGGAAVAIIAPLQSVIGEVANLTGALVEAAPVTVAFGVAFGSIVAAAVPVISTLKKTLTATNQVATGVIAAEKLTGEARTKALEKATEEYESLTDAQKKLVPIQIQAFRAMEEFQRQLAPESARVWTNLLVAGLGTLKNLRTEFKAGARAVADFTGEFRGLIANPRTQRFFSDFVILGGRLIRILTGPLIRGFDSLFTLFRTSIPTAERIGVAFGNLLDRFSGAVQAAERSGGLGRMFNQAFETASKLFGILGNLTSALFIFFRGNSQVTGTLLDDLTSVTQRFEDFMKAARDSGDLKNFLVDAHRQFKLVIGVVWDLGRILTQVVRAALPAGEILLGDLRGFLQDVASDIGTLEGQGKLRKFFMGTIPVAKEFGRLVIAVGASLVQIGQNPSFLRLMERLRTDVLPAVTRLIEATSQALSDRLIDALVEAAEFLEFMAGSNGPVKALIDAVTTLLSLFNHAPGPVKLLIANLLGIQVVAKVLGINFFGAMFSQFKKLFAHFARVPVEAAKAAAATEAINAGSSVLGPTGVPLPGGRTGRRPTSGRLSTIAFGATGAAQIASHAGGLGKVAQILKVIVPRLGVVGLAIGVVVGAIAALKDNFLGVADLAKKVFGDIAKPFKELGAAFDDVSGGNGKEVVGFLKTLGGWVLRAVTFVTKLAGAGAIGALIISLRVLISPILLVVKAITAIIRAVDFVIENFANFKVWLGGVGQTMIDFFADLPSKILGTLSSLPARLFDLGKSLASSIGSGLKQGIKSLGGKIGGFVSGALGFQLGGMVPGSGRGDKVKAMLEPGEYVVRRSVVSKVGRGFFDRLNYGGSRLMGAGGMLRQSGGLISGVGAGDASRISPGLRKLNSAVSSFSDDLKYALMSVNDTAKDVLTEFKDIVATHLDDAIESARDRMGRLEDLVDDRLRKVKDKGSGHIADMGQNLSSSFSDMFRDSKLKIDLTVNTVGKGIDSMKVQTPKKLKPVTEAWDAHFNEIVIGSGKGVGQVIGNYNGFMEAIGAPKFILKSKPGAPVPKGRSGANTGGRFGGSGLMDTVPVMAAPGEVILNRHQEGYLEQLTGKPGILDHVLSAVRTPHFMAQGGRLSDGISQLASSLTNRFKGLTVTSTTGGKHAANSYHYLGQAVDLGGPSSILRAAADYIKSSGIYRKLSEAIHNPNLSVKHGKQVATGFWGRNTWAGHANHLHLAMAGMMGPLADLSQIAAAPFTGSPSGIVHMVNSGLSAVGKRARTRAGVLSSGMGGEPHTPGTPGAPGRVTAWLSQALRKTGYFSAANLRALTGRAMQESGGNPRAVNLWDSNAKRGTPSKGILQTIDSTFNAYKMKGHSNIWNPVDNAIAAIRYMYSRYGRTVGPSATGYARGGRIGAAVGLRAPQQSLRGSVATAAQAGAQKRRLEQELSKILMELSADARALILSFTKTMKAGFVKSYRRIFGSLKGFIGDDADFTSSNIQDISRLLAQEDSIASVAGTKGLPPVRKNNPKTAVNERKRSIAERRAIMKARNNAKEALPGTRERISEFADRLVSGARDRFDSFRGILDRGSAATSGRLASVSSAVDSLKNLDKLSDSSIGKYQKLIQSANRTLVAFNLEQRFNAQAIRVSGQEIGSLGDKFKLLKKIAKESGADLSGAMAAIKTSILDAMQTGIDRVNAFFDAQKNSLDAGLASETDRYERERAVALTQRNKQYDDDVIALERRRGLIEKGLDLAQLAFNAASALINKEGALRQRALAAIDQQYDAQTKAAQAAYDATILAAEAAAERTDRLNQNSHDLAIKLIDDQLNLSIVAEAAQTRAQEREQRRRARTSTTRDLGKLIGQEYLTAEDVDRITQLQQQLADDLKTNAAAERSYTVEDRRENLEAQKVVLNEQYAVAKAASDLQLQQARDAALVLLEQSQNTARINSELFRQRVLDDLDFASQKASEYQLSFSEKLQAQLDDAQTIAQAALTAAQDAAEAQRIQIEADSLALTAQLEVDLVTLNNKYDDLIAGAQTRYAEALVDLTNQTQDQIGGLVNAAAAALGVNPGQIWDYILGGASLAYAKGKQAGDAYTKGLNDGMNSREADPPPEAAAPQFDPYSDPGTDPRRVAPTRKRKRRAGGGRVGGYGFLDYIPTLLAPGEAVVNRHQERWIEAATGFPGILNAAFGAVRQPHFASPMSPTNAGGRRIDAHHTFDVKVDARGLTSAERAALVNEVSRHIVRESQFLELTAPNVSSRGLL